MSLVGSSEWRAYAPLSRCFIPTFVKRAAERFAVLGVLVVLVACARSPTVTSKSELRSIGRQASYERSIVGDAHVAKLETPSYGVASYYDEGTQTASGEDFDPQALTAAHPNLPFGTKLRVTNVATGKSVIVRVNDRGPFVPGRIVDVSHSAAAALGMIGQGTAKVKVDVVQ
jgi:rare lipoprotein A